MRWRSYLIAATSALGIAMVLRFLALESAGIAAPPLLLDVVIIARLFGLRPAILCSVVGAGAYEYYFLPPSGFGIDDPNDWLALAAFLATAVFAGELASRAERRTAEAQEGRREIERLYQELQVAFERASEAEAARRNEALKAALLDALTHNLRTPLTSIKAAVTAMLSSWNRGDLSNEDRRELLEVIDQETDRLNRFIEGLSTADRQQAPLVRESVTLARVIRSAVGRASNVTRDFVVSTVVPDDLPEVSVDPASTTEVLYMLLDNASKYAAPGTRIDVRAETSDDRSVKVTVADEGPGIPSELRERVFERFFRVPGREPKDRRRGGVGLGLPIARRLVEAQGGHIWIEDTDGRAGTTVALTVPLAAGAPDHQAAAVPAAQVG